MEYALNTVQIIIIGLTIFFILISTGELHENIGYFVLLLFITEGINILLFISNNKYAVTSIIISTLFVVGTSIYLYKNRYAKA